MTVSKNKLSRRQKGRVVKMFFLFLPVGGLRLNILGCIFYLDTFFLDSEYILATFCSRLYVSKIEYLWNLFANAQINSVHSIRSNKLWVSCGDCGGNLRGRRGTNIILIGHYALSTITLDTWLALATTPNGLSRTVDCNHSALLC